MLLIDPTPFRAAAHYSAAVRTLQCAPVHVRTHGPFLKWAGGKRQLLAQLRRFYPPTIGCYFEPFVGSGAVFFDLMATGRLHRAPAALSDENADLIGTYLRVRDDTEAVIAALS